MTTDIFAALDGAARGRATLVVAHSFGVVVGVRFERGAAIGEARRAERAAGRIALREALCSIGAPTDAFERLASTDRGAPESPSGYSASITHKGDVALAFVAASRGTSIGVDLERVAPGRASIAPRILTADEIAAIDATPPADRDAAVLTRFAVKEAVYKAVDPLLRRDDLKFRSLAAAVDLDRARERFAPVALHWRVDPPVRIPCRAEVGIFGGRVLALVEAGPR